MKLITPENILLVGSSMLLLSIFAGRMSSKFGIPSLLLFLLVGMVMGSDGVGYHFDNAAITQFIGIMALSVILFSGGMDTRVSEIRPILSQGLVLATLGVISTAFLTGCFIWFVGGLFKCELSLAESMLLASVMSSTDSASVFALLRSKGLFLKENLRATLELESGSNDPMAYILTIVLISYINGGLSIGASVYIFIVQIILGASLGVALGYLCGWIINKAGLDNVSLYSVLLVACVFLIFSITDRIGGNGYLAVYISGLIFGNLKVVHMRNTKKFFSGFAWLWQIIIFLTLGLLVNPRELLPVASFAIAIGVFLILIGRPLSVIVCLLPFKNYSNRARAYISWVGLRGAVPIIFATYPLVAKVPNADIMFNVVFFITIMSLIAQGMTVTKMADWLGVSAKNENKKSDLDFEIPDEMKSILSEIDVTQKLLESGDTLMALRLPKQSLVISIKRDGSYFIPNGSTTLHVGDRLFVLSGRDSSLKSECEKLGVPYYLVEDES